MMEIPVIRTVGEWLLAMGNYADLVERERLARESDDVPYHRKFLRGDFAGVRVSSDGEVVYDTEYGYDPATAEITSRAGAADIATGIPELRAIAEAEGEVAVTIPWVRKKRGELFQAGRATADVDAMTLVEFGEAIRRRNAAASAAPEVDAQSQGGAARPLELLVGKETKEILAIAKSDKTVEDRMRAICAVDLRYLEWDSPTWAKLLDCTPEAVRKSDFWKLDRPRAIEANRRGG